MYLKVFLIFCIGVFVKGASAQHSSGGGTYEVYKKNGVVKVEEYHYNYNGLIPCDSTPFNVKFFNEKGQMIKEVFGNQYSPYYTYEYNDEGFLFNIDTNGLFGYGSFTPTQLEDTLFEHSVTEERWFLIDTMRRILQSIRYDSINALRVETNFTYDKLGKVLTEVITYKEEGRKHHDTITINYEYNEMSLLEKAIRKEEDQVIYINEFRYYTTN